MSYAGLIFDLSIAFFLINKSTRVKAAIFVIIFNIINHLLFPAVGVFPLIMLSALIIFFDPQWPHMILEKLKLTSSNVKSSTQDRLNAKESMIVVFVFVYCILQLIIPVRHFFYKGDVLWTSQGERFTWRMILKREIGKLSFIVTDKKSSKKWDVNEDTTYLIPRQYRAMSTRPELMLQFAHFLKEKALQKGFTSPLIRVESKTMINNRKYQVMINPDVDLTTINPPNYRWDWVNPFDSTLSK